MHDAVLIQLISFLFQLVELTSRSPPVKPITDDTEELCSEIIHNVSQSVHNVHVQELHSLLQKPHFKVSFSCFVHVFLWCEKTITLFFKKRERERKVIIFFSCFI